MDDRYVSPIEWGIGLEESTPIVFSDDPRVPDHLRSDCPMVECYRCRRQSVREVAGVDQVNVACAMTQPDGSTCPGRFIALTYPLGAS